MFYRNILESCGLINRTGNVITNLKETFPKVQSDLAKETLKDPYCFDFLTLTDKFKSSLPSIDEIESELNNVSKGIKGVTVEIQRLLEKEI